MFKKFVTTVALVAFVSAFSTGVAFAEGKKGTATLKGKVTSKSEVKPKVVSMGGDAQCTQLNKDKKPPVVDPGNLVYKAQGNAIPDVFVYISKGVEGEFEAPEAAVKIDQKDCMYVPHVFGMIAGQSIDIVNSDSLNHNVHSLAKKNPKFNFAQPRPMTKTLSGKETFTRPEEGIKIKCDVHSWMSCYVFVLTHPFFGTSHGHLSTEDKDAWGTYEIKEIPAGKYTITAWHENFGEMTKDIEIKDGEAVELNFEFDAEKKAEARPIRETTFGSVAAEAPAVDKPACCVDKKDNK